LPLATGRTRRRALWLRSSFRYRALDSRLFHFTSVSFRWRRRSGQSSSKPSCESYATNRNRRRRRRTPQSLRPRSTAPVAPSTSQNDDIRWTRAAVSRLPFPDLPDDLPDDLPTVCSLSAVLCIIMVRTCAAREDAGPHESNFMLRTIRFYSCYFW